MAGITAGTLTINGTDEISGPLSELFTFSASATLLSSNKFKTVSSLTPSWSSFAINVNAVNEQGEPVSRSIVYGPYLCSVTEQNTFQDEAHTGRPGLVRGSYWRVAVYDIVPQVGDFIVTGKGVSGFVGDIYPVLIPNFPRGWAFLVTTNPA